MDNYQYTIKNKDIAQELVHLGFKSLPLNDGTFTVSSPAKMSKSEAKEIISFVIKLYTAAKDLLRAQKRYDDLAIKINEHMVK